MLFPTQDEDGKPRQQLVTVDTSPRRGLRGPSNFFGHPSDDDLSQLDAALAQSESDTWQVPRVVLGHYPLSFQAPSESGLKVQQVLSRRGVLAYFPGHLHYKFGRRLHRKLPGSFWEVELGDWKDNRAVRLFALDGGQLAFSDWLASGPLSSPLGLLTSPPSAHYPGLWSGSPNLVKVLAFNLPQESTLVAEVYRSEEEALTPGRGTPPLLSIPLESTLVMASSGRYMPVQFSSVLDSTALSSLAEGQDILWLRVSVGPTGQILCGPHPFSPSGTATSPLYRTWVERTVQGRQWASDWPSALGLSLVALCLASLLPWALHRGHLAHRDWPGPPLSLQEASKKVGTATLLDHTPPHRDDDVSADVSTSLLETSSAMQEASPVGSSRGSLLEAPGKWYLKMVGEYSRCPLWYLQVVSLLIICLGGPLFWGNPLGKHLSPASLSIWGWYLPPSDNASPPTFQGVPDILMIVLPYFILCFFPLTLWLPAWNGERLLRRHLAVMTADVAGKSGEERREVGEVGFRVLGLCGEEGKAFGGSLVRRRSFQEGSSGGGEKIEGEVVKGLKRGMEKVPNQFPGFRAPLLALRGGIWLSGLLVAYFNYWVRRGFFASFLGCPFLFWLKFCVWGSISLFQQIATMFHAYGKYVLLVSPGFAWFPVCALFYVWTHW